jgi:hypothetical protein
VRFLVPLPLQERVVAAGGRIVHASMRKLLGAENADATGFTIDLAVAEGRTRGGRLGGMQVVAASYRWEGEGQRQLLGGRTVTMPSNNNWFVQYLDAHQVLGWLDYLAHDFKDPALLRSCRTVSPLKTSRRPSLTFCVCSASAMAPCLGVSAHD